MGVALSRPIPRGRATILDSEFKSRLTGWVKAGSERNRTFKFRFCGSVFHPEYGSSREAGVSGRPSRCGRGRSPAHWRVASTRSWSSGPAFRVISSGYELISPSLIEGGLSSIEDCA